jgi:hypothetical protein
MRRLVYPLLFVLAACPQGGKDPVDDTDTDAVDDTDLVDDTDTVDTTDTDTVDTDTVDTDTGEATDPEPAGPATLPIDGAPEALMGVHGRTANDVWMAGADNGRGALVIHWDGTQFNKVETGIKGDIWWVQTLPDAVLFSGQASGIYVWKNNTATRLHPPGLAKNLVFGTWASAEDDIWAVGTTSGRNGFIWHYDGAAWETFPLPDEVTLDANLDQPGVFKVWGDGAGTIYVVGTRGTLVKSTNGSPFELVPTGASQRLLTVAGANGEVALVGGDGTGVLLTGDGSTFTADSGAYPVLQGVTVMPQGTMWASGLGGAIFRRTGGVWAPYETGLFPTVESFHAIWTDPDGGVWAVGGGVISPALNDGTLLHIGAAVPSFVVPPIDTSAATTCPAAGVDPLPSGSIARRWNEQMIGAIRRDIPRPGVHARNLFHVSSAMWDAWTVYDDTADGLNTTERILSADPEADREIAISYAAYRVLYHRYANQTGGVVSSDCFNGFMGVLGLDPTDTHTTGDDPIAVGNRVGQAVIDAYAADGANEAANYADTTGWTPVNQPMIVDQPGAHATDPEQFQQLILAEAETQNGIPVTAGVQGYIGANWGYVTPFAITGIIPGQPFIDLGGPPVGLDGELADQAVDVLVKTAKLDPRLPETIDLSPGAYGNNPLGTNDGTGHPVNPITGLPYAPNVVRTGDFGRVLAEFWADGPKSETPPGHWFVLANDVSDNPLLEHRLWGEGEELDRLSWDVHMYLALGGAVHDAAIAAWGLKRVYTAARPITLIRTMAERGQRTDPSAASYDPEGLPLIPGVIELITAASSAPGERHEHLARYEGMVAVVGWLGEPGDRSTEFGGVDWMLGVEWIPYQRRTFVTPAFPGYISGHSTFSRSAAEALTLLTGSAYFPGGFDEFVANPGSYLVFEDGPVNPVHLQWATYQDAADQAGQSRLWGGIHIVADDFDGRSIGYEVGHEAIDVVHTWFEGTARP